MQRWLRVLLMAALLLGIVLIAVFVATYLVLAYWFTRGSA